MELSECCNERAILARCTSGWLFGDELLTEYYECQGCKNRCELILNQGADDGKVETGSSEGSGSCEAIAIEAEVGQDRQGCASGSGQELGDGIDERATSAGDVETRTELAQEV